MTRRAFLVYFFLILSIGAALRIYKLGADSLWFDEAIFLLYGSNLNSLSELLGIFWNKLISGQWHLLNPNLLYSVSASYWGVFAKNEFVIRLPSAFFGVACIPAIYYLGKALFNNKTGLISAFILAISPFHIYYSQELRMYSLIALFTIVSAYFFIKFLQSGRRVFLTGYIIFCVLNIYTHIVTALILAAEILFFLFYRKKYACIFKRWLTGNLVMTAFLMPQILFVAVWARMKPNDILWNTRVSTTSELGRISLKIPFFTFKNFCAGYNATRSIYLAVTLLFLILFVAGFFKEEKKERVNFCLICLFVPVFIMYIFQTFIYADRYLIPSSVFLYLVAAVGLAGMRRPFAAFFLASIFVLTLSPLNNYYRNYLPGTLEERIAEHSNKEYREAVDYIVDNFQDGDFIIYTDFNSVPSFEYYLGTRSRGINVTKMPAGERKLSLKYGSPSFWPVANFSDKNNKKLIAQDLYLKNIFGVIREVPFEDKERVWLVFSAREFKDAIKPGTREYKILEWFEKRYARINVKPLHDIILYLYKKA